MSVPHPAQRSRRRIAAGTGIGVPPGVAAVLAYAMSVPRIAYRARRQLAAGTLRAAAGTA
eukprot:2642060-Rhodomonas_salina.2